MAKRIIQDFEWGKIMNMVRRGSNLSSEAERLGISREELVSQGDQKYDRNSKDWEACKRLSEKREKRLTPKKRKPVPEPTPAPEPDQTPAALTVAPMEELLRKREGLKKELVTCATSLEEAEAILAIRQEALADAKAVLEKAQLAVKKAEADKAEAKAEVQQAQAQQHETQAELQGIEQAIQELKEKTVYLVDPWFNGEFPAFGTFLSTVEMEGVQVLKPVETIEPDFKDMVSSGFDLVSEYTRALSFVSLVQEYILKGEAHSVLNTDPRVQKLLDKHIG